MTMTKQQTRPIILFGIVGLLALLLVACGGGAEITPTVEADPFVNPLPLDRAEMALPGPDGVVPCGLAEVGWGYRVFNVGDEFPECAASLPNLAVYCLNGEAQWSAENVTDVDVSILTKTVTFEVRQDGLCALFPMQAASATPVSATPSG